MRRSIVTGWTFTLFACAGAPGGATSAGAEDPSIGDGDSDGDSTASSSSTTTASSTASASTTTSASTSGTSDEPQDTSTSHDASFDVGGLPDAPGDTPAPPTDIEVVITADNAYAFGYGTDSAMQTYFGGVAAVSAGQIFNCGDGPETYVVPADDVAEYLYIVAYADAATTQGVLGQFRRLSDEPDGTPGATVYTGDEGWEVCATGIDFSPNDPAPTLDLINAQITACNDGSGDPVTSSAGWVDADGNDLGALAVGETNDTPYAGGAQPGNEFPLVCAETIDPEARWMWFNWDPTNIVWPVQSPFLYPLGAPGNPMHDFMIFRLASEDVPAPPAG